MEQRLSLVTLGVADLERSQRFYEALGWKQGNEPGQGVVFFQSPGMIVALWSREELAKDSGIESDPGGWGGVTLAYNVRSPEEADAVLDEARQAGATIAREGAETFWAAIRVSSTTPMAMPGRSRTILAGRSPRTAPSVSD